MSTAEQNTHSYQEELDEAVVLACGEPSSFSAVEHAVAVAAVGYIDQ
jgi:hypothetical protein